jgi:hypothetical protein
MFLVFVRRLFHIVKEGGWTLRLSHRKNLNLRHLTTVYTWVCIWYYMTANSLVTLRRPANCLSGGVISPLAAAVLGHIKY